jgi:hypothetical protein
MALLFLAIFLAISICSPEGIRTLVADLRSQSPRPLDDGAVPKNTRTYIFNFYKFHI